MSPLSKILRRENGFFVFFLIIALLGSQRWVVCPNIYIFGKRNGDPILAGTKAEIPITSISSNEV
jgi:hypothetical protein